MSVSRRALPTCPSAATQFNICELLMPHMISHLDLQIEATYVLVVSDKPA